MKNEDCDFTEFFHKEVRTMHTHFDPLECNAKCPSTDFNDRRALGLMRLNPDINHGILQYTKIAEINNNANDNTSKLKHNLDK